MPTGVKPPLKFKSSRDELFCRDTELSVSLHGFQVQYAVSFARQHGLEMKGGVLSLGVGAHLELLPLEDHLIHRLQADWSVRHFSVQLEHTTIWLVSSNSDGEEVRTKFGCALKILVACCKNVTVLENKIKMILRVSS